MGELTSNKIKEYMAFLPENYKEPVTSSYMKLEEGDNTIRILGSFEDDTAIMGLEYWKTIDGKKKPFRVTKDVRVPISELEDLDDYGNLKMPAFFWAVPVWNVQAEKVQILEITQKTIRQAIEGLARNKKWGDPKEYDVVITRTKEGGKTSYSVTPDPKEKLDSKIMEQYKALNINMLALFEGGNPFASQQAEENDYSSEDIAEDVAKALN